MGSCDCGVLYTLHESVIMDGKVSWGDVYSMYQKMYYILSLVAVDQAALIAFPQVVTETPITLLHLNSSCAAIWYELKDVLGKLD